TFAATTPPGATSPLMLLLFCLMSMQFGALAILLNSRNTASLLDELETCFRIGRELLGKNLENLPLREIFLTGVFQSKSSQ
ncbi:MAG: hypothetical protein GX853_09685, partial [Chloroflexi bacterium]|nr:hypothetical protein [Chloroflexota bacterium]